MTDGPGTDGPGTDGPGTDGPGTDGPGTDGPATGRSVRDRPSARDLATIEAQLGRPPRGVLAVAARTHDGEPAVVTTAPRLPDGTPFPTFYYLTHPVLVAAMSRLEADGRMRELNDRLAGDPDLAAAHRAAHAAYLRDREAVEAVPELAGVSAGGLPDRVKCLHALAGHALAAGPGVDPVGDLALAEAARTDAQVRRAIGGWPEPSR